VSYVKLAGERLDELIGRAAAGDQSSLESLLVHFHDPLLRWIGKLVLRDAVVTVSAEEVLQETLIAAFRGMRKLEPRGERAFFAWLKTIARSRLINQIKAAAALKRGGGNPAMAVGHAAGDGDATVTSILGLIAGRDPTPSLVLRRKEASGIVAAALARLEPGRRRVIEWHYGQGLPVPEIAARLGKGEGAIKMLIHRAVKEMRDAIKADFGEFSVSA
jgi:RNA polymerase sigma-70 factor (ECF subfamily)